MFAELEMQLLRARSVFNIQIEYLLDNIYFNTLFV